MDIARALLALGADFKHTNRYAGETCLHSGARYGRDDIVSLLIAKGADMEMYDWHSLKGKHRIERLSWHDELYTK